MRISGLSSGMDIEKMINDLVAAERIPVDRVYQQKVLAEWKRDAYREVNTKLLRFRNLAFDMGLQTTYQKNVATSSLSSIASVSATTSAQAGSYELKVNQLAESGKFKLENAQESITSYFENNPDEEKVSFELNGKTFEISKEKFEASAEDALNTLTAEINKTKDLGVSAFHHNGQISFNTKETGEAAKITVDATFAALFGGDEGVRAQGTNAEVEVNGLKVELGSNTFDLNGITVTLHEVSDKIVRIESRQDTDALVDKVKEFVNLYNELVDEFNGSIREGTINKKGNYEKYLPLTPQQREELSDKEIEQWEAKAKSGLLRSDPLLGSVLSEMRLALGATVQGLEGNKSLAQIGIKTGAWYEYGRLNVDEEKLRAALEENPDNVRDIFTKQSENDDEVGVAKRLTSVLDRSMSRIRDRAGKENVSYDESYLGRQIRDYEDRLSIMEDRLLRFEENQWRKFTAMEKVLSQLNAQSDWLYQQLMTMQG